MNIELNKKKKMVDGLARKEDKPSNTEVLGLLLSKGKLPFITKLNGNNLKRLCLFNYHAQRLQDHKKDPFEIHKDTIELYLTLKCSVTDDKKGNRSDQIVDALKHITEEKPDDELKTIGQQIKG